MASHAQCLGNSVVLTPSRRPLSTSVRLTDSFSVADEQPIFGAIDSMVAHYEGYSPRCSCTRRTARSRTSGEYLFVVFVFMASFSQELKPPYILGRFRTPYRHACLVSFSNSFSEPGCIHTIPINRYRKVEANALAGRMNSASGLTADQYSQ